MRKLILLAVIAAVALVSPAFAAVQNVKISGDIDSTYLYRQNFDFNLNSAFAPERQSVILTQTRLRVDADLSDNVAATIALINERVWENDPSSTAANTGVDLNLAYVTLREMLYSPLTLIVGRQNFRFGNGFIMDSTGTNNTAPSDSGIAAIAVDLTKQTAMDAVRAIFDYNPLTIDIIYAKLDQNSAILADVEDDVDLIGINANYQLGDTMNSVVEAYFWNKYDQSNLAGGGQRKAETIKVVGVRGSTNPIEGLNLQAEFAHQGGAYARTAPNYAKRDAWGLQGVVSYQIPALEEYKPMVQYVYTKVTGDTRGASTDADYTGWDPFFENQGGGTIYNTLFDLSNAHIHTISIQANPMEDLTAKLSVTGLWLQTKLANAGAGTPSIPIKQPDGSGTATVDVNDSNRQIGKEIDLELNYAYTEDVTIGTNFGYFKPGSLFHEDNDTPAKQLLVHMNVAF